MIVDTTVLMTLDNDTFAADHLARVTALARRPMGTGS